MLAAARRGTLCVDMSTIDPAVSQRMAKAAQERGVRFMDAPVSGGTPRATDGTLAIMVGGAAADFEEARPALAAMGANVIHVGAVGSGEVVKLCNNLIAGVVGVAVSEAFRIAEGFGMDPKVVTDVISKSSGNTFLMGFMHPVPGVMPARGLQQRVQAGVHDRPHVQGPGPGGGRGAQSPGAALRDARGAAGLPPRLVPRPRAARLHERLLLPQAVLGPGSGLGGSTRG